jgi:protein SCO1/2
VLTRVSNAVRIIGNLSRATLVLGAIAFGLATAGGAGAAPPPLANLFSGGFELIDHNGKPRSSAGFRGRFMLIFFGYTYCPTICPTNLQHMAQALEQLGDKAKNIQPIFITIDPARDTPGVLKDYLENFGTKFLGLTGTETQIRGVAKSYRVHRRKVIPDKSAPKDYLVDHSSLTLLIGPDGKFRTLFPHNTTGPVMARRMEKYLGSK